MTWRTQAGVSAKSPNSARMSVRARHWRKARKSSERKAVTVRRRSQDSRQTVSTMLAKTGELRVRSEAGTSKRHQSPSGGAASRGNSTSTKKSGACGS